VQDFRTLRVWQLADQFTLEIYKVTRDFPSDERFGLTAQLRSAALSIQSNIAEGFGRGSKADTSRFLQMSIGSTAEVTNHLHVSRNLGYLSDETYQRLDRLVDVIRRMLIRLLFRLRSQS
jgi:four helix bundle protein